MLRRIIACFALITGLAAVGMPVDVRAAAASQQVESCPLVSSQSGQLPTAQIEQRNAMTARSAKNERCRPRKPVQIYIPTIQLGPDRSRE